MSLANFHIQPVFHQGTVKRKLDYCMMKLKLSGHCNFFLRHFDFLKLHSIKCIYTGYPLYFLVS